MPDLQGIELKAHRSQTNNLITLFTFNRKVWVIPPLEAIKKYGSYDKNGRKDLSDRFQQKIPVLILVSAFTEERDDKEYFHFYEARLMTGTTPDLLENQFKAENILVDLRLHDKGTSVRNHGTGFRTYENKLPLLFQEVEVL